MPVLRWYYSLSGKAEGPVTEEFLIEQLKAGKFTLVDLVFKEGESAWKTFGEIPAFREAYQAPPAHVPPPPAVPTSSPATETSDISFDEISIDEFTPTPIHTVAPVHVQAEPLVVPESVSAKQFTKPEEGWPSDWRLSSSWIVLKKRLDGNGYDQDGPFSAEHIIEMIGQGKIEYSQYCWKPGYTRWFRIGNLPEFDRRKRDRENDTVNQIIPVPAISEALPALTREELLSNVERMRSAKKAKDKAPEGTTGKNLVETPFDVMAQSIPTRAAPEQSQKQKVAATPPPAAKIQAVTADAYVATAALAPDFDQHSIAPEPAPWVAPAARKKPGLSPKLRLALAAFVAVVVVGGLMQAASMKNRQPASTVQPDVPRKLKPVNARPKTSMTDPLATTQTVAAVATPQEAPPPPPKAASSVEINPKDLETAPKLQFTSDMGALDKITVKIKAHSGEILSYGSYSKTFEVPKADLIVLDLSKENLPAGNYFVEAQVGAAQASTQIFVGKNDDAFTKELERHIKSISLRQQSEKTALFYGAQKLEKLSKDLISESAAFKAQPLKWKKTFAVWRGQARDAAMPVIALSQSPATEQAYPEEIAAFQAATERLAAQAKDIDASVTQKRDIASGITSAPELAGEFGKLREESAKLTGRPHSND